MNERDIWERLLADIENEFGVAGLMGNLFAESTMNPMCKTGGSDEIRRMTGEQYVLAIKTGKISADAFAHDEVAYGLAQWRYWSRKQSLLRSTGADKIDNPIAQIEFLLQEIRTYKTVWAALRTATSVREASDMVLLRYERPASMSTAVQEKRAAYGMKYYALYADPAPGKKMVKTTADRVFVRSGNGKQYAQITRVEKAGTSYEWVATSGNGWHAVALSDKVGWISGEFAEVIE